MRAAIFRSYGGNEVMEISEIDPPKLQPDSILVRARAASVNPVDWKVVRGGLDSSFPTAFPVVPGWDVAGVVEAVGTAVSEFAIGDEVLACARKDFIGEGTFAELVSVPIRCAAHKPSGLPWATAAALPFVGLTALQVMEALRLAPHHTMLVHGGSGGVGSLLVQLAAQKEIRVIASASVANHEFLSKLGAEPIAYGPELHDVVARLERDGLDAIVDLHGHNSIEKTADLLNPPAREAGNIVSIANGNAAVTRGGKYVFARPNASQLQLLADLVASGELRVEVSRTFPLAQIKEAFELSESGHTRGKIVVEIG